MSREHSRLREFLQLGNDRLLQAELSLRYWHEQNSLFTWAPFTIFIRRPDFRSLELALIQEWQPRLNYPVICQFFHTRKGLLKRPAMSLNPQFGLATLWRKRRHKFKPAPKASAIRLPWTLSPDLERTISRFFRQWFHEVIAHHVPCHDPSFKVLFVKHQAVLDILCNHKAAMTDWSMGTTPTCCCQHWPTYRSASLNPTASDWVISGALLAPLLPEPFQPLCSGSLLNKVFPSKRDYSRQMSQSFRRWAHMNGLPSIPTARFQELIDTLWSQHKTQITSHLTKSSITQLQDLFPDAIFHCEDKHASSLRIFCPVLYYEAIDKTFMDPQVFVTSDNTPTQVVDDPVEALKTQYGRTYPWAIGRGRQTPSGYILSKAAKEYRSGRAIIFFVDAPFRPMLNILARMLYQLIPVGCPHHFAVGDVYELLPAGFFTSIEPDRFIGAWYMLLDFLRPKMNVNNEETFALGGRCPQVHHFFVRHIRYVDNRLLLGDPKLVDLPPYETLLDEGFYGRPILLETEPDQEFLGFMIATEPFELIYCGPTDTSQVLSPFLTSPPKVLLGGCRSRCHIVAKGAHPLHRVHAGIQQLIDLYTLAGFEATDLHRISSQILASTT
eukprot:s2810_g7.t1